MSLQIRSNGAFSDAVKSKDLFRGAWSPDVLLAAFDFNDGLVDPWSTSVVGPEGHVPVVVSDSLPSSGIHLSAAKLETVNTNINSKSKLHLDVSGLNNLTRVKYWRRFDPTGYGWSPQFSIELDGSLQAGSTYSNDGSWVQAEQALLPSTDQITFVHRVGTTANEVTTASRVTGVEVYGTAVPYMIGEFVTHEGKMWESLANNNAQTPSETATAWKEALSIPPARGTTAERPDAIAAGSGFQYYDETLGKPIWSNGATWADAVGSAV